ncbi:Flp/Fap pilin component [Burkholderia sp. H160]|nr:Flp/Fap pilin component [Burkholderia sp. H160]
MLQFIKSLSRDERGVSALEYAVLAGIVVIAVVAAGSIFGSTTGGLPALFQNMITKVTNAQNA